MKERINYLTKHYLINGGKALWAFMATPKFAWGLAAILFALAILFHNAVEFMGAALAVVAPGKIAKKKSGVRMKIDTTGLKGENLKMYQDLAKRMKITSPAPKENDPKVIGKQIRSALAKVGLNKEAMAELTALLDKGEKGYRSVIKKLGTDLTELKERAKES